MIRSFAFAFFLFVFYSLTAGATLHVGAGQPFPNLQAAINAVQPGDTIEIHGGTYPGGLYFANVKGTAGQWITIRNTPGETVIFEGGNNAIQLSDPAYLHIRGIVFQHQTGNGFNTDDGGSYDTPAHHIIFENCIFRDMSATGNNDLLKLSGLDFFEVRNCLLQNGAAGGSGIDMVGCHHGVIQGNTFVNMGSNAIQCKGGSEWVRIEGNFFKDCGQRTLNLGGSTGLAFFRPDTAHFEAANLQVYSNIIIGSWAAVAYVGSVNVEVVNNTIYQPENWVIRILQETVDPDRFLACGNNAFRNNIVYIGNLPTETNVGPNTAPTTFVFSNNLWYNADNANWGGPDIPVNEANGIVNQDPQFADADNGDFSIPPGSPAAGAGISLGEPGFDYFGQMFAQPPSVGAVEAAPVSSSDDISSVLSSVRLYPNPGNDVLQLEYLLEETSEVRIELIDGTGRQVRVLNSGVQNSGRQYLTLYPGVPAGVYWLRILTGKQVVLCRWVRM
ncbi:MAG: DUF5123 domain-containing protein [Lewinellaceae bacterium]|nr:DUF5123 domain-containing protein [Lewinellaceae bacterium]